MKHLLSQTEFLEKDLKRSLLLLDYDGTLTPIVSKPGMAKLSPEMRKALRKASSRHKVAVISGRSLADVGRLVGLRGIYYAGNHGFEISGPSVKLIHSLALRARPNMAYLCGKLRKELKGVGGAIVEDKWLTASVHYRMVGRGDVVRLKETVKKSAEPLVKSGAVRLTRGKKVMEVRPNVDWDKGKAVLWVMGEIDPKGKLTPVYLGDDRTDEDAFEALADRGITVLVARRPKKSKAKFFLKNVKEVEKFLESIS